MYKLTLSDEHEDGNIPTLEYEKGLVFAEEGIAQVKNFINIRNGNVIVIWKEFEGEPIFTSSQDDWCEDGDEPNIDYNSKMPTFFITIYPQEAIDYSENLFKEFLSSYFKGLEEVDINVFCFESFEEAFSYLTYLKEGY